MKKSLIYAAALIAAVGCNKEFTDDSTPVGNVIKLFTSVFDSLLRKKQLGIGTTKFAVRGIL